MPVRTAKIQQATLELTVGDITHQRVDAVVNAANSSLLGGGGVDGAIHRAAGLRLLQETIRLGGCETGNAKLTGGYGLPAKHIIHAVGPVYRQNDPATAELLASAYRRSLELAAAHNLVTVALPAISTGVYRYPPDEAAAVALAVAHTFLSSSTERGAVRLVRFVLFNEAIFDVFWVALRALAVRHPDVVLEEGQGGA